VVRAPQLTQLHVGDVYPKPQIEATLNSFRGRYFFYRGHYLVGDHTMHVVDWRMCPDQYLALLDRESSGDKPEG
jgi:hypothetical protein